MRDLIAVALFLLLITTLARGCHARLVIDGKEHSFSIGEEPTDAGTR